MARRLGVIAYGSWKMDFISQRFGFSKNKSFTVKFTMKITLIKLKDYEISYKVK